MLTPVAVLLPAILTAALAIETQSNARRKPVRKAMTVWATAYCLDGKTRSGAETHPGVIAADPKVLPIGSLVRIEGAGPRRTYTVLDTGLSVKGAEVDIFIPDCRAAKRFGRRKVLLEVLRTGDG